MRAPDARNFAEREARMIAPSPRYRSHRGRGRSVRGNGTRDRHAGIPACRAGARFFLAEPPPRREWRHRWARPDPCALSRAGGRSRRRRVDLMPNSQKSARPSSPPTMPSQPGWSCAGSKTKTALTRCVQYGSYHPVCHVHRAILGGQRRHIHRQHAMIETVAPTSSTRPVAHLPSGNFGVNSARALKDNHRIAVIPVATQSR